MYSRIPIPIAVRRLKTLSMEEPTGQETNEAVMMLADIDAALEAVSDSSDDLD